MEITLQYFDGCPNWQQTDALLRDLTGGVVSYQLIDTMEAAEATGFRGSPTILIDGVDPFADADAPVGLSCRIYQTESGPAGAPSREQLSGVLRAGAS